jgi:hypothetical protein
MPHKDPAARREQRRRKYAEDAEYRARVQGTNRAWAAENADAKREIQRRSHDKHREKRNAYSRTYVAAHPESSRLSARKAAGIVAATGESREGACQICTRTGPLVCDHDHCTGRIRGWLCRRCNLGLGQLGDTLDGLRRAVSYLESPL